MGYMDKKLFVTEVHPGIFLMDEAHEATGYLVIGKEKACVIDTMNGIMVSDEIRRMKEKGYDKWVDLAVCVMDIIDTALSARDDLVAVMIFHSQTIRDDNGNIWTNIRTNGQKLGKIVLETKLPIVLLAKCVDGEYIFETQSNNSTAKSPMGMLEKQIPNDIAAVIEKLKEYEE